MGHGVLSVGCPIDISDGTVGRGKALPVIRRPCGEAVGGDGAHDPATLTERCTPVKEQGNGNQRARRDRKTPQSPYADLMHCLHTITPVTKGCCIDLHGRSD